MLARDARQRVDLLGHALLLLERERDGAHDVVELRLRRDHAMMMVQYLLDSDERAVVPGVAAPQVEFGDIVAISSICSLMNHCMNCSDE